MRMLLEGARPLIADDNRWILTKNVYVLDSCACISSGERKRREISRANRSYRQIRTGHNPGIDLTVNKIPDLTWTFQTKHESFRATNRLLLANWQNGQKSWHIASKRHSLCLSNIKNPSFLAHKVTAPNFVLWIILAASQASNHRKCS